jgi:hypothetical protein
LAFAPTAQANPSAKSQRAVFSQRPLKMMFHIRFVRFVLTI